MSATEQDLRALAHLAKRLREDTHGAGKWDDNGLWAELKRHQGQQLALVVEKVTRHAADPEARTPAAISRPFVPGPPTAQAKYPMRAGDPDECRTHVGQHRDHCPGCASDALAGDDDWPEPHETTTDRQELIAATRSALRAAMRGGTS